MHTLVKRMCAFTVILLCKCKTYLFLIFSKRKITGAFSKYSIPLKLSDMRFRLLLHIGNMSYPCRNHQGQL